MADLMSKEYRADYNCVLVGCNHDKSNCIPHKCDRDCGNYSIYGIDGVWLCATCFLEATDQNPCIRDDYRL